MKDIDGFIADTEIAGEYIVLDLYGKLGFSYSVSYIDSNPKLYLKSMPSFDEVYANFMSHKICFLKINLQQDMCLSLFYNPYFEEFYDRVKTDIMKISKNRLKFLRKYLLAYLADPIQFKAKMYYNTPEKKYFIEHNIYDKSKELIDLINNKYRKYHRMK